jgi:hypothetical protein
MIRHKKDGSSFPAVEKKEPSHVLNRFFSGSGLNDLAAPQAAGAEFDPLGSAVNLCAHHDQVGPELADRFVVRMADIVSEHAFFPADFTLP